MNLVNCSHLKPRAVAENVAKKDNGCSTIGDVITGVPLTVTHTDLG